MWRAASGRRDREGIFSTLGSFLLGRRAAATGTMFAAISNAIACPKARGSARPCGSSQRQADIILGDGGAGGAGAGDIVQLRHLDAPVEGRGLREGMHQRGELP